MRGFLAEFDGLTSSRVQSRIAAPFIHGERVLQEVAGTTAVGEIDVDLGDDAS